MLTYTQQNKACEVFALLWRNVLAQVGCICHLVQSHAAPKLSHARGTLDPASYVDVARPAPGNPTLPCNCAIEP